MSTVCDSPPSSRIYNRRKRSKSLSRAPTISVEKEPGGQGKGVGAWLEVRARASGARFKRQYRAYTNSIVLTVILFVVYSALTVSVTRCDLIRIKIETDANVSSDNYNYKYYRQ